MRAELLLGRAESANLTSLHVDFLSEGRSQFRARRLDLLIHQLLTGMANYYLHKQHRKAAGFSINLKLEKSIKAMAHEAHQIGDSLMRLPSADVSLEGQSEPATVTSSKSPGVLYHVFCPGTAVAICTGRPFQRTRLCKHVLKVEILTFYFSINAYDP